MLSRVIYGSRISLLVGFVSVGIATLIGLILGSISGYYGGIMDEVIMRFVDLMMCFPTFFLILAVIAFLEPSIWNIMAVIGLTSWMGISRLVRAEFLSIKSKEFVLAAKSQGLSSRKIIFGHVLPNALSPVWVVATLGVGGAILTESALELPRDRRAAADRQLGQHPRSGKGQHRDRLVALPLAGPRHLLDGDGL